MAPLLSHRYKLTLSLICTLLFLLSLSTAICLAAPSSAVSHIDSIRVVMDDNYPPYVFKDEQGTLQGIIIDQWRLWEKKTGMGAELSGLDWAEAQQRMQAGQFDVIDTIFFNENRAKIYAFTNPYAVIPVPLFFHSDISGIRGVGDAQGFLVAAKAGGNVLEVLKKNGITNIAEYPSYESIIAAARDGQVKVFTVDRPPALYYLNKMGIQNQFRETAPMYAGEFHRAVRKGRTDLLAAVEVGFDQITPAEFKEIDQRWMGRPLSSSPYLKFARYLVASFALVVCILLCWLWTLKQAVARKTHELSESQEFLSSIVENIPNMIFVKDATDLKFVKFNKAGEQLLGISRAELIGRSDYDFFSKPEADLFTARDREILSQDMSLDIPEEAIQTATGQKILHTKKFIIQKQDGSPKYLVGIAEDITARKRADAERQKMEQQLLHTQKLESLGILAGGIAHDFNNILSAIIGNVDLALRRINKDASPVEHLQRIKQAAGKAADLARQMLNYSGKGKFQVESLDLNDLLAETLQMLEVSISKKASLCFDFTRPLPSIEADATQLRQLVMNLIINASEAIGDASGIITITTRSQSLTRSDLSTEWCKEKLSEGDYVCLEIADTGCGMDAGTLDKLFDPFFTTKFTGRGLGMAAVQGIVHGHQGAIRAVSTLGKGSVFTVLLPASCLPTKLPNAGMLKTDWQGQGKVLLVDDEEWLRQAGIEMLEALGFNVISAKDGREAMTLFKSVPDIDLVLLDLTMPQMDGEQCFKELRQLSPGVKVIMTSGYSQLDVMRKLIDLGLAGFVQKPYGIDSLRETIQRVMPGSTACN